MPTVILANDRRFNKDFSQWRFSVSDIESLTGPGVYIFFGRGGKPLYIGSGKNVIARCMTDSHHRAEVRECANTVEIYPCGTIEQAHMKESNLISELQPKFNCAGKRVNIPTGQVCQNRVECLTPFDHLVESTFPEGGRQRLMGFFTVYFDDSGTHLESSTAICACYIASLEQWKEFTRNWNEANERENFGVFHMADFARGEGQFKGWDDDRKKAVLGRLCNIINTRVRKGCAFAVTKKTYEEVIPLDDAFRLHFGKFHYTFAVRSSTSSIRAWRNKFEPDCSLRYVFDRMTKGTGAKGEIERIMDGAIEASEEEFKKHGIKPLLGYSFENKADILPLQAADILAWTVFQRMQHLISGRRPSWIAEMALENLRPKLEHRYFENKERLEHWVETEKKALLSLQAIPDEKKI